MTAINTRAQATVKSAGAPSHLEDTWLRAAWGNIVCLNRIFDTFKLNSSHVI